jgi:hypothetical protein
VKEKPGRASMNNKAGALHPRYLVSIINFNFCIVIMEVFFS